jgi:hypothetical protein
METSFLYLFATVLFIAQVLALLGLVIFGLNRAYQKANLSKKGFFTTTFVLIAWLIIISLVSASGFFQNFQALPPRIFITVFVPTIMLVMLLRSPETSAWVQQIPPQWLINLQSFRILMEIILWLLFLDKIVPIQMTFEGRNFDILVGITAPIFAYLCFGKKVNFKLAILWNIGGLLLLGNIVGIAIFSAPTPFRVFMNEPANTFIASMPYTLLPAFVVPVALYVHALSIKQLLGMMKEK